MTRDILLATTNTAKTEKLSWLLAGLDLGPVTPREAGLSLNVSEDGTDHRHNAELKALAWSTAFQGLAIASDGGALIPALGARWDSLRTHRFAGDTDDRGRVEALLALMEPFEGDARRVVWREAVAIAERGSILASWDAQGNEGVVAPEFDPGRVRPDFWVETVWYLPQLKKRHMDCTPEELARAGDPWGMLRGKVRHFFGDERRGGQSSI